MDTNIRRDIALSVQEEQDATAFGMLIVNRDGVELRLAKNRYGELHTHKWASVQEFLEMFPIELR